MAENLSNSAYRSSGWDAPALGPVTEQASVGASIVIKGEVSGQEALFIDGTVEGSIHFPEHRVTVGRHSKVTASIRAREVVVMGSAKGNIQWVDLLDVRAESNIQGDIITRRVRIDDGAILKGSVEIQRPDKAAQGPDTAKATPAKAESAAHRRARV
jgi:cytoskeletal protein CcmA (bactofilin family)